MAVTLTVSKAGGRGTTIVADTLAGGDLGFDMGQVVNGSYVPNAGDQTNNAGFFPIYAYHNATKDPITEVGTYIDIYPGSYGGANIGGSSQDIADLIAMGDATPGLSANNGTGNERGFWIDHRGRSLVGLGLSRFDPAVAQVRVYGQDYGSGQVGVDLATAIPIHVDAMAYYNTGTMTDATAPVTGVIGKLNATDTGDTAWMGCRFYLNTAALDGGIMQWAWVWAYSYTA